MSQPKARRVKVKYHGGPDDGLRERLWLEDEDSVPEEMWVEHPSPHHEHIYELAAWTGKCYIYQYAGVRALSESER